MVIGRPCFFSDYTVRARLPASARKTVAACGAGASYNARFTAAGRPCRHGRAGQHDTPFTAAGTKHTRGRSRSSMATKQPQPSPRKPKVLTEEDLLKAPEKDYMNEAQLAFFRQRLIELRDQLLQNADDTGEHLRENEMTTDPSDRATLEEEYTLELRTRDRERKLLKKVEKSMQADRRRQLRLLRGDRRAHRHSAPARAADRDAVARGAGAARAGAEDVRRLILPVVRPPGRPHRLPNRFGDPMSDIDPTRRAALKAAAATATLAVAGLPTLARSQTSMFTLPPLPYADNALAPVISANTHRRSTTASTTRPTSTTSTTWSRAPAYEGATLEKIIADTAGKADKAAHLQQRRADLEPHVLLEQPEAQRRRQAVGQARGR